VATLALLVACVAVAQWSRRQVVRALGWWGVPLTTGWLGVPVHELSHVLAAWSLGRKVERVQWFAPDAETGTLGAVHWQPGKGLLAWLAVLWVGVAPLAGGAACLQGILAAAASVSGVPLPTREVAAEAGLLPVGLALWRWAIAVTHKAWQADTALRWASAAAWWAMISIAGHMLPSRADLQGTWRGGLVVAVFAAAGLAALQMAGVAWQLPARQAATWLSWQLLPGLALALAATLGWGVLASGVARWRGR
jgi:hypothetical protein